MPVTFDQIQVNSTYTRPDLARIWGYASHEALHRGVVTPRDDNKIILFVTEDKSPSATPYHDRLVGDTLEWDGPNDHFAEERMVASTNSGDKIHLFHRFLSRDSFTYRGPIRFVQAERHTAQPSRFTFTLTAAA